MSDDWDSHVDQVRTPRNSGGAASSPADVIGHGNSPRVIRCARERVIEKLLSGLWSDLSSEDRPAFLVLKEFVERGERFVEGVVYSVLNLGAPTTVK